VAEAAEAAGAAEVAQEAAEAAEVVAAAAACRKDPAESARLELSDYLARRRAVMVGCPTRPLTFCLPRCTRGCARRACERVADPDYLLAVKDNQPTLHADIKSYFETAPSGEVEQVETLGKDHGRIVMTPRGVGLCDGISATPPTAR
jgi:hypothetical protein